MNLLLTSIVSIIFSIISFLIIKNENYDFKYKITVLILIFIGTFVRLYQIDLYPVGLNQDEASIGYESISIFKYGIDRFGMSYPTHLISWGSGQNALYAYLIMPLIFVVKNDILLIRLPMALFGSITLLFVVYFIKKQKVDKEGLVILLLFVIMPWHIMKSRWGLESNIFPEIVLYGLILLYLGIVSKNKKLLFVSSIVFGISTYSYGTSYLYIPLLLLLIYIYLIKNKKVTIKESICYIITTGIVSLPMILFVIINYLNLDTIKIFNITIPKLYYNRFTSITSVNGNLILNCLHNLKETLKIIITCKDNMPLNSAKSFGTFYIISLPFLIYGLFIYFKKYRKKLYLNISFISLISGLVVSTMVAPNINRINFLWFPIYVFIILGITNIHFKPFKNLLITIYIINFICFSHYYFGNYQKDISSVNNNGLKDAIVSIKNNKQLYITQTINQPYIFWLYYNKVSPHYYLKYRNIINYNVMFQTVQDIGTAHFYIPNGHKLKKNEVYIVQKKDLCNYDTSSCITKDFNNFTVIEC